MGITHVCRLWRFAAMNQTFSLIDGFAFWKRDSDCALQDESIDTTFKFSSQVFLSAAHRNTAYTDNCAVAVPQYGQSIPRNNSERMCTPYCRRSQNLDNSVHDIAKWLHVCPNTVCADDVILRCCQWVFMPGLSCCPFRKVVQLLCVNVVFVLPAMKLVWKVLVLRLLP